MQELCYREALKRSKGKGLLICMMGYPRAGKSTWAKAQQHPIVCLDAIRMSLHGQRYVEEAEQWVCAFAETMIRSLFHAGHHTVIFDATNVSREWRERWISLGYLTVFKLIETSKRVCIERAIAEGSPHMIEVIEEMDCIYEPLDGAEWRLAGDLHLEPHHLNGYHLVEDNVATK